MNTQQYFHNIMMQSPTLFDSKTKQRVCITKVFMNKIRITPIQYVGLRNKGNFLEQDVYHDEAPTRLKRIVRV